MKFNIKEWHDKNVINENKNLERELSMALAPFLKMIQDAESAMPEVVKQIPELKQNAVKLKKLQSVLEKSINAWGTELAKIYDVADKH